MKTQIYHARKIRGWTSDRLNHELRQAANRLGFQIPKPSSLRVQISGWENGLHKPGINHQLLLQEAFKLPADALDFNEDTNQEMTETLLPTVLGRSLVTTEVSDALLTYFVDQLSIHARADNATGPSFVLTTTDLQSQQLEILANCGPKEVRLLAARYAEFLGWLLQDSGDNIKALRHTDRAVELAEANGDVALTAYDLMRKSSILTSLREFERAKFIAWKAVALAEREAPSLLPVCLRQYALAQSYLRDEHAAKTSLQRALELSQPTVAASNGLSPYCTTSYVHMEAALCLLALGDPSTAATACNIAVERWPRSAGLVRDESLCLARLAVARSQLRQVDEACEAGQRAAELVMKAPSARAIHMLRVTARRLEPFKSNHAVQELTQVLAEVA